MIWSVIALSIVLYFAGKQIPEEPLRNFIRSAGPLAPLLFIAVNQIAYIIAPISSLPFLITGFYMFGPVTIVYLYVASVIGFAINFYISRRWGRPFLASFTDNETMAKVDKLAREHGITTLVALRLLHGGFGDYVSYAYGFTNIRFKVYFLTSAAASLPGQLLWFYLSKDSKQ